MTKTLVTYCTHVINRELLYFIDHGYIKSDNIDFYVCLNGEFDSAKYNQKCKELDMHNLYFYNRENTGHDFGGWTYIINLPNDDKKLYETYDYFIFLNSTCMGPFLPVYCTQNWVELFINMINDKVKLIGPTINHYLGKPHVQSYFICTDKIGLEIGIEKGIFNNDVYKNKMDIVFQKEIKFSLEIINAGYNIKSLLKGQEKIDFNSTVNVKDVYLPYGSLTNRHLGDMCYRDGYFDMTIHPYEVIFFKSNRNITNNILDKYIQFNYYMKNNISDYIFNDGEIK